MKMLNPIISTDTRKDPTLYTNYKECLLCII